MKQLTEQEAIEIDRSGVWKGWTKEDIVKFQLYQGRLCMPWDVYQEAVEAELGRSVWTHEFADDQRLRDEYEGKRGKPTSAEILGLLVDYADSK